MMTATTARPTLLDALRRPAAGAATDSEKIASMSTGALMGVLGLAAFFVLTMPGQPLAAMLGFQSCMLGG